MSRTAEKAAERLLEELGFPKSKVSVWVSYKNNGLELLVRLDPDIMFRKKDVPISYAGYKVRVTKREIFMQA